MSDARLVGLVAAVGMLASACATPPVTPMPEASRRSVTALSGDVSGIKQSDTSKLGARGSAEGGRLGAAGGARDLSNSGLGLATILLLPAAMAIGGAIGASAAQPEDVVDTARANLRIVIQDTDFTEMLRSRLAASKAGGNVEIVSLTSGASGAPVQAASGTPPSHTIAVEYRLNLYTEDLVNPKIGVFVQAKVQVMSVDRKQVLHTAAWNYCGELQDFIAMSANNAAPLRAQIDTAATTLAEAIPHDLFVSKEPRYLTIKQTCMDFRNLPGGTGYARRNDYQPPMIDQTPQARAAVAMAPAAISAPVTPVAATVAPAAGPFDGGYSGPFVFSGGAASVGPAFGRSVSVRVLNGTGTGTIESVHCGSAPVSLVISPSGDITGQASSFDLNCSKITQSIQGRAAGGQLDLTFDGLPLARGRATLIRSQ